MCRARRVPETPAKQLNVVQRSPPGYSHCPVFPGQLGHSDLLAKKKTSAQRKWEWWRGPSGNCKEQTFTRVWTPSHATQPTEIWNVAPGVGTKMTPFAFGLWKRPNQSANKGWCLVNEERKVEVICQRPQRSQGMPRHATSAHIQLDAVAGTRGQLAGSLSPPASFQKSLFWTH